MVWGLFSITYYKYVRMNIIHKFDFYQLASLESKLFTPAAFKAWWGQGLSTYVVGEIPPSPNFNLFNVCAKLGGDQVPCPHKCRLGCIYAFTKKRRVASSI